MLHNGSSTKTNENMMAFLDDLENYLLGNTNSSDKQNVEVFLQLANETKNMSLSPYILDDPNASTWRQVLLIVAYGILIMISVFGNTLVCLVVFRNRKMHTVTYFFIANLAIADVLLTCINVPFNLARYLLDEWPFGSVMCHLLNFSLMVSVYVCTFTLMGIALDRQQVLLYPLSPRMSKPVGLVVLGAIWLLAVALSLPFGLYNKVQTVDFFLTKVKRCTSAFPVPREKWEQYLTLITLVLQFIFPLTVIAVTYGRIVRKLWVRTHVGAVTQNQQVSQQRAKRKSIKMLIIVVAVFAVCWMPLNLYQVLADFHPNVEVFHYNSTVFFICHWIAISSACYNPFVYCWLNESFRAEVKSRFKCCFQRPKRVHPGTEIDGFLLRSDRAYRRRQSKSSISVSKTSIARCVDKYKLDCDIPTREQSEFLTENVESPISDNSMSTFSAVSCTLATVPEYPEHYTENHEVAELTSSKNHVSQRDRETRTVSFMM